MSRSQQMQYKRYLKMKNRDKKYDGIGTRNGVVKMPHVDFSKCIYGNELNPKERST